MTHAEALDHAAKAGGFHNYLHAYRQLRDNVRSGLNAVYITKYWRDPKTWRRGRETSLLKLSQPLEEICSKNDLKNLRHLSAFRIAAKDHVISDYLTHSQEDARKSIAAVVREITFMSASGLRPIDIPNARYPGGDRDKKLPGMDHASEWIDPVSGQIVILDEPYEAAVESDKRDRERWSEQHGWYFALSKWPGIYYPYHTVMYVMGDRSSDYDFDGLLSRIDALAPPLLGKDVEGESTNDFSVFLSPAATTKQDKRRAKAKGTILPRASNATVPYNFYDGNSGRRPNGRLSLAQHKECGDIIKAVLKRDGRPFGVYQRLNRVRSEMEDWLNAENPRDAIPADQFFDYYYHDPDLSGANYRDASTRDGKRDLLSKLITILQKGYPDCQPIRQQTSRLRTCIRLLGE